MHADHVEFSWDASKSSWLLRIEAWARRHATSRIPTEAAGVREYVPCSSGIVRETAAKDQPDGPAIVESGSYPTAE